MNWGRIPISAFTAESMDIRTSAFYFFSIEQDSSFLPAKAHFKRKLLPSGGDLLRECALIQLEACSRSDYPFEHLIVVPRHSHGGLFGGQEVVQFVNVFDGRAFLDKGAINLSDPGLRLLDIGGLTFNETEARTWQARAQP